MGAPTPSVFSRRLWLLRGIPTAGLMVLPYAWACIHVCLFWRWCVASVRGARPVVVRQTAPCTRFAPSLQNRFSCYTHTHAQPIYNHLHNILQHFATHQYTPCCGRQRLRLKDGSRAPELVDVLSSAQVAGSHAKLVIEIKPFNEFAAAPLCKLFAERPVSGETACTIAVPTAPAYPTTPNSVRSCLPRALINIHRAHFSQDLVESVAVVMSFDHNVIRVFAKQVRTVPVQCRRFAIDFG